MTLQKVKVKKWNLPSEEDGNSFMCRSMKAEKCLIQALELLQKIKESIPHTPSSQTKELINDFLIIYK